MTKTYLSLDGKWTLAQVAEKKQIKKNISATVPGDVYRELLDAGLIPDPFYRKNEADTQWIGRSRWEYSRTFNVSETLLANEKILLRCDGLDTVATIALNGSVIAKTENMFRTWEFDVTRTLKKGANKIVVTFASPIGCIAENVAKHGPIPSWGGPLEEKNRAWLRKEPCNFGWDWGPNLPTAGIWRSIGIVAFSEARIDDVLITQEHTDGAVALTTKISADVAASAKKATFTFAVTISKNGRVVAESRTRAKKSATLDIAIPNPALWWPNNMGDQPLYDVNVELQNAAGDVLDVVEKRVGLRTLKLDRHADEWGESFQFVVNGIPFFAKGANWIPGDAILSRMTADDYRQRVADTRDANMNMLRVWGGGIYEADVFYDACDEMGICVWQDFMFACSAYPLKNKAFLANIKEEFVDNVRRIRHHACIALWCGNNELEQGLVNDADKNPPMNWEEYCAVFDKMIPDVVAKYAPQHDYWPASPHSPHGNRADHANPNCGDAHLWSVWHGREPFEWYRTCTHRFNSEFGFQSFPEERTVAAFTRPEDRNITSPVMEYHQRSGVGNAVIIAYMLDWFRLPGDFAMLARLSQILQGMAMKYACEHWRRQMPRGMGTLYWQLNDCWPVASWSSVDYFGRWKATQYMAKKFFAPMLLSAVEDPATRRVDLHITSDREAEHVGTINWFVYRPNGETAAAGTLDDVVIPARANTKIGALDLAALTDTLPEKEADLMLWLELEIDGEIVSDNFATFARPKAFELRKPPFTIEVAKSGKGTFALNVHSDVPALWAWLDLGDAEVRYSDNYAHIMPHRPLTVTVTDLTGKLTAAKVAEHLKVYSLYDTYQ